MTIKLSKEQRSVIFDIVNYIKNNDEVILGGYAGTGKTTLVKFLSKVLENYAVCAFTGKAANILRRKGIQEAKTIHSLIYKPLLDENGNIVLDSFNNPIFILNPSLECDGIIVDESSMVSKEIYEDLKKFNVPIIFVGDHGQLEPVGTDFNLMKSPIFKLEEIHRNAGEIAHFADFIRKGYRATSYRSNTDKVVFLNKNQIEDCFEEVDQIICAYNKTRVQINKDFRKYKKIEGIYPECGEKLMCLKNDKTKGLFNGMQGIVTKTYNKPKNKINFLSYNDEEYEVLIDFSQLNKEKYDFEGKKEDPMPFDYAYCITCHKSQGDEWNNVMVIEQFCKGWEHKRWAYTAASRAKNKVIWIY